MKKSILLLLSLMLCLILSPRVYAETVEKDKAFYEVNADGQTVSLESITDNEQKETYMIPEKVEVNGNTYMVTAVKGGIFYAKKIVIPATVKQIDFGGVNWGDKELEVTPGNPVYKVKNNILYTADGKTVVFSSKQSGTVKIADGVKTIAGEAFHGSDLTALELPKSLEKIEAGAFENCTKLRRIKVSAKNPYMMEKAGALYTKNGKKLLYAGVAKGTLMLPKKTTQIAANAFYGNTTVEMVFIQGKMKKLAKKSLAFSRIKDVTLPDSLQEIEEGAFMYCSKLADVEIPKSVKKIGANAFDGCYELERVVLPQKLTTLEKETFRNCYSLRKIDLPKSLRTIKAGTFESCGFNQLVIPKSVKSIGKNALQVTTKKLIFKGKNVPKIAKQDACQYGKYAGNTDPDFDLGVVRLDYIDIQYPMQHGIGKVKVPAESTGKYKKALKGKMEYRELEY